MIVHAKKSLKERLLAKVDNGGRLERLEPLQSAGRTLLLEVEEVEEEEADGENDEADDGADDDELELIGHGARRRTFNVGWRRRMREQNEIGVSERRYERRDYMRKN